jgi:integrase
MRCPSYLYRSRHSIYYFRWPLPRAAASDGPARHLKVSLETRDPKLALRLAQQFGYLAQRLVVQGIQAGMRFEEIRAVLQKHFQDRLLALKARIAVDGRLDRLTLAALQNGSEDAQQALDTGEPMLADALRSPEESDTVSRFVDLYKMDIAQDSPQHAMLAEELKRAFRDYCAAALAYNQSLEGYDFSESGMVAQIAAPTLESVSRNPLNEVCAAFIEEGVRTKQWAPRPLGEKREHLALLQEILGPNTIIESVTAENARQVKIVLQKYPKSRNKNPRTRNLSLAEAIELSDIEKLNVKTINNYLQSYSGLFSWAKANGYVESNPFAGLTMRVNRRVASKDGRQAFSPEQTRLMLGELTNNTRGLINRDHQKWGPLIGLYTGARLNEIGQLGLQDIRQQNEIWCVDFNDEGDDKRLKNEGSRRLVPLHPKLIELGFLEHIGALKKQGQTRLFPKLTYTAKNGWGRNLGRWFNEEFLVALGIKSKPLVFHSLRHTVVTTLLQAGVDEQIVKAIVGHSQSGVTQQHYFKQGYTIKQLHDAIELLRY